MKDKSPWLVLDVSYICWRNFHAMGRLQFEAVGTTCIFGLLRDLVSLQDLYDTKRVVFCFDRGRSLRCREFSEYKANRSDENHTEEQQAAREELRKQMRELRRHYLKEIGYQNVLHQHGYEADDIIASVCRSIASKQGEAIIVGADKDLYQLLSARVSMHNMRLKKIETIKSFTKEHGINPVQWVDVKAMAGCSSDNVPGIVGIGEKTAIKFLRGQLKPESDAFQKIVKGNDLWQRNRALVELPYPGTKAFELYPDEVTENKWRKLAKRLGMRSMMDAMTNDKGVRKQVKINKPKGGFF